MTLKRKFHHGDLREALIRASADLIAEHGGTDITLRQVAERIGVTHAAAYRHFDSKAALLSAVAVRGFDDLRARLTMLAEAHITPFSRIEALCHGYLSFASTHPGTYRALFAPEICGDHGFAEWDEAGRATLAVLVIAVDGLGRPVGADPLNTATAIWAGLHGYANLFIDGHIAVPPSPENTPALSPDQMIAHLLAALR